MIKIHMVDLKPTPRGVDSNIISRESPAKSETVCTIPSDMWMLSKASEDALPILSVRFLRITLIQYTALGIARVANTITIQDIILLTLISMFFLLVRCKDNSFP